MNIDEIVKRISKTDGLSKTLGMKFISTPEPDTIMATMKVDERNRQPFGFLSGGASLALLAANAHLPMPKLCIINSDVPNAFATGRNPSHAAVAVTTGIMRVLDYNELSGVLGHELMHVYNHDILTSAIASALATIITYLGYSLMYFGGGRSNDRDNSSGAFGLIGALLSAILVPIGASLVQMAISRTREFDADEDGSRLTAAMTRWKRSISFCTRISNGVVMVPSSW